MFSATFPEETVAEWKRMVALWQDDKDTLDPFDGPTLGALSFIDCIGYLLMVVTETTQDDIHKELLAEELAEQCDRTVLPVHETTVSTFLKMGMDLEQQQ